MSRGSLSIAILFVLGQVICPASSPAVTPSEQLLPATTKGFLSLPDMDSLRDSWEKTQLGELANDPAMKPFADDLKRQIKQRLTESGVRLAVTLDDLDGVYGGEVCLALVQPGGAPESHAVAMLVDVTGQLSQANTLLASVHRNEIARGATRQTANMGGATVAVYTQPKTIDNPLAYRTYYFVYQNRFVGTDHGTVAKEILGRLNGEAAETLASVTAFRQVMSRCNQRKGNAAAHVRWFVEPFGYAEASRAAQGGRKRRGTDLLKVLRNQGFDAVQGVGGIVTLAAGKDELVHRTLIYAPAVAGAAQGEKYTMAARVLDFGAGRDLAPPTWAPGNLANYVSFTFNLKEAFYHSKSLVNEVAGDDVFDEVLDNILRDPHGPQVDIRNDLVAHLGTRVTLLSDCKLPITPKSDRLLVAVEMKNPTRGIEAEFAARDRDGNGKITSGEVPKERRGYFERLLSRFDDNGDGALTRAQYVQARSIGVTLDMAMEDDPDAQMVAMGRHRVWEMVKKPGEPVNLPGLDIQIEGMDGMEGFEGFGGLSSIPDEEPAEEDVEELPFANAAFTYADGLILISTHVDMLKEILEASTSPSLGAANDYQRITAALQRLGGAKDNLRGFTRMDEAYRVTYELLRQGRMPESESVLGQLLNKALGAGTEDGSRQQEIDASKLPEFKAVSRYLGPAGFYMRAEPAGDGWYVVGTLLRK